MSKKLIFPYAYSDEALDIEFLDIWADEIRVCPSDVVDESQKSVNLTDCLKRASTITLRLRVRLNEPEESFYKEFAPFAESESLSLVLILRNGFTRVRKVFAARKEGDCWTAEIVALADDLWRVTELSAVFVLKDNLEELQGYACRKFERVASSGEWKLYTDTIPPMPGGALNGEWHNFAESQVRELRQHADCIWYVDLSNQAAPKLYLNEGCPNLRSILDSEQKRGRVAAVRDALIHSIVQPVIFELAVFALTNSKAETLEDLNEWQHKLLGTLASQMDEATSENVLRRWLEEWSKSQFSTVLRDLTTAVQRHVSLFRSSEALVKSVAKEVASNE